MSIKNFVRNAFLCMHSLGIKDDQVKPVLKNLLAAYDQNWEFIVEDNYRVLADVFFNEQEVQKEKMNPRTCIRNALSAMRGLGIKYAQVKPVLKKLLALYNNDWEFISKDNYRVLANAIFADQEVQNRKKNVVEDAESRTTVVKRGKKKFVEEDEDAMAEPERPLKRYRHRGEGGAASNQSTTPSLESCARKL